MRLEALTYTEDTLTLQKLKYAAQAELGPQLAHDAEWRSHLDYLTGRLLIQLRTNVYAEKIEEISKDVCWSVDVPADWWQALRERVLDARGRLDRAILNRWPIRYRTIRDEQTVTVERWATFPDNATVYPKDLGAVVYRQEFR